MDGGPTLSDVLPASFPAVVCKLLDMCWTYAGKIESAPTFYVWCCWVVAGLMMHGMLYIMPAPVVCAGHTID